MATVHPSRMGLVPQDPKDVYSRRARSPSPPYRRDRDRRERDGARDRESDDEGEKGRGGDRERERDRRRERDYDRSSPRRVDDRDRGRYRERGRDKDKDKDRSRRASPEYDDYKRPASPGLATPTPSMYPNRQSRDGPYERRGGYGGDFLERCVAAFFPGVNLYTEMLVVVGGPSERVQRLAYGRRRRKRLHAHCTPSLS